MEKTLREAGAKHEVVFAQLRKEENTQTAGVKTEEGHLEMRLDKGAELAADAWSFA